MAIQRTTGFVESDGERIYWESAGEGPALVLTHGAGGNHAAWFQQIPAFARTRRVIAWDQRGFGSSTARGGPNTPERAVRDLTAVLDALGVAQADLVGQSMGGWAVLGLALAEPTRVRRLVLADTPGGIDTPELGVQWAVLKRGLAFGGSGLGRHPAVADDFFERHPERAVLYQQLGTFGEPELAKILPALTEKRVGAAELARLRCPVLLIVGEKDALFPPIVMRASAELVPDARLVEIPRAGHSPYFEEPEAWNRSVAEFLEIAVR
jgi:pimeloyl-ACP methyl ester carboxylesterase